MIIKFLHNKIEYLMGAGGLLWLITHYSYIGQDTLISSKEILFLFLSAVATGTLITWIVDKKCSFKTPLFIHIIFNVFFTASIVWFVFLNINYHFHGQKQKATFNVLKRGHTGTEKHKSKREFAVIKFGSNEVEIVFPYKVSLYNAKTTDLILAKGFFGYTVILEKYVKSEPQVSDQ